ncbi:MAG: hypothetical protein K0Q92_2989, partial [Steroidobacteraceae bacterium]|nr:hypothetical protein [Steroidobacteraceae bacterium]
DTHAAAEDIHYWNFTLRGSSGQGINAECRSGSIINGWIYGSIGIGLALHNQTDREGDWVLDNVHSYDSGGDGIKVTPVHAGFARLVMRNLSATDAAGVGVFIDGSASHDISLRASNWDITRSASATASAYVINVNGGSIKGVHVQDPTQVGQTGLRLRDVTHLSVSQVTGRLASEAVGALVYFNATGAGTCSDCTIDNVVGESPAAVSSRGILLDNNARDITVGRVLRLDDFTTPISWGSGTGHVGGLMRGTLTTDPASLAAGATQTFNVTVPGVAVGDVASASFTAANVNINWFAEATGTGNVTVTQKNNSGGAIDLASGTIKVVAFKAG